MKNQTNIIEDQNEKPVFSFGSFTLIMLVVFAATLVAVAYLPAWLPGLSASINGEAPKAFWYLSRGSAIVAYLLLWLSMMLGTGITSKLAKYWPGLPSTIELHEYTSILGLAFGLFHGLILMGDKYINFNLAQVLVPFSSSWQPMATGIGQVAFYVWAILNLSFYIRKIIGRKLWRAIHFFSFPTFLSVLVHSILAGTDTAYPWMQYIYLITSGLLVFMVTYRILTQLIKNKAKNIQLKTVPPEF